MRVNYLKQLFNLLHGWNYTHLDNDVSEFILINNAIAIWVYLLKERSEAGEEFLMLYKLKVENDFEELRVQKFIDLFVLLSLSELFISAKFPCGRFLLGSERNWRVEVILFLWLSFS